ncbi:acid phosphatase [Variovorax sp. dw_308]|uniref:acid phosphatase n=1 Tax=Variovorax sp. dw_308 TaxID=2721546 RepID=UPI001C45DFF4|nr:acid phosphatase [Variovorax sp. dw_308]
MAGLLAACSSSGGVGGASGASTSGIVTDGGYYRNAKVCVDANANGRCDAGEASTMTDANGAFTVGSRGALVAEIGTSSKRIDPVTGAEAAVTQPLVFRAPADANGVLSAISTQLVALAAANGGDMAAARAALAARLGVSEARLMADPVKLADPKDRATLQRESAQSLQRIAEAVAEAGRNGDIPRALRNRFALDPIKTVVIIYAENRAFDNLYGLFPGANGVPGVNPSSTGAEPQKDFDGAVLPALPPAWGGMTAAGQPVVVTQAQTVGMPNRMYRIDDPAGFFNTGAMLTHQSITRDLTHRFYVNQMQINGGRNDKFAAYSDVGALSMGYLDGSHMKLWQLARRFTLADNFFMGAFGGSYLNHQYLVCACVPTYPNADADNSPAKGLVTAVDVDGNGNFLRLTPAASSPASVLNGPPVFKHDSTLTPKDASGMFHAVNTMQPPYQPSSNAPAASDSRKLFADPSKATTLPPQTQATIGDLLSAKGLGWAWYGGAWASTTAIATGDRAFRNTAAAPAAPSPNFQFHHQPFNYYARFDPAVHPEERAAHLKDFDADFLKDMAAGTLPAVSFYKPQGNLNQHPGYANVSDGDAHIAELVGKLQASPQWKNMLIVVTYDENGGFYDHATVPRGDRWGPGTRIPAIVISPFARKGFVDKTQYDTASTLRFITHRWSLPLLPGLVERDNALLKNGGRPMGDLTGALDFGA